MHACVYSFCCFPPSAINNEGVTRSMWPCKIQHNAACVTNEVTAGLPRVLQVNAMSKHVEGQVWSLGLTDAAQPSCRDEVSHEVGEGGAAKENSTQLPPPCWKKTSPESWWKSQHSGHAGGKKRRSWIFGCNLVTVEQFICGFAEIISSDYQNILWF